VLAIGSTESRRADQSLPSFRTASLLTRAQDEITRFFLRRFRFSASRMQLERFSRSYGAEAYRQLHARVLREHAELIEFASTVWQQ
jgi:hypothetical protein